MHEYLLYTKLLSFRRKVEGGWIGLYPLAGWKSGGVIGTTTVVRRQKTRKGLGGDGAEYSLTKFSIRRMRKEMRPGELLDRAVQNFRNIMQVERLG